MISVAVLFYNIYFSARYGQQAVANPWRSRSPEFLLPSPVPVHNYDRPIEVVGNPYDYGLQGSTYVQISASEMAAAD